MKQNSLDTGQDFKKGALVKGRESYLFQFTVENEMLYNTALAIHIPSASSWAAPTVGEKLLKCTSGCRGTTDTPEWKSAAFTDETLETFVDGSGSNTNYILIAKGTDDIFGEIKIYRK